MSAIKNYYHDEITKGQREAMIELQMEEEAENQMISQEAEKAEFFRIFELTGTYPM